jgi:hypothetical protein
MFLTQIFKKNVYKLKIKNGSVAMSKNEDQKATATPKERCLGILSALRATATATATATGSGSGSGSGTGSGSGSGSGTGSGISEADIEFVMRQVVAGGLNDMPQQPVPVGDFMSFFWRFLTAFGGF